MVSRRVPRIGPEPIWTVGGVVVLLAGGAIGARFVSRSQSAADIPLESISLRLEGWEQVENEDLRDPGKEWPEAKQVEQLYKDPRGRVVRVSFKATYTRIGALRDYSLGRVASGWTVEGSDEVVLEVEREGGPLHATVQRLRKDQSQEIALSWYCSPDEVVADLRHAALVGWRGGLLGPTKPWAQVYIVTDAVGDAVSEAEALVTDVGMDLAPQLRDVLVGATT